MAGWNGSGGFDLLYNWTQDAANALPISSSRMQAQDQLLADGLENCMTLDGQTTPTANITMGGFAITNLGAPGSSNDAATKSYVDSAVDQWKSPGTIAYTWLSASSFRFDGGDYTTTLVRGRRIKIIHNGGATTSYGVILSSSYGAPNTTVNVVVDGGAALVAPVTAAFYSLLTSTNIALPQWSLVQVVGDGSTTANMTTATPLYLGLASTGAVVSYDRLSEFATGTGRFTALDAGKYDVTLRASILKNGATLNADPYCDVALSGAGLAPIFSLLAPSAYGAGTTYFGFYRYLITMTAGQYLQPFVWADFTGGPTKTYRYVFSVERVA